METLVQKIERAQHYLKYGIRRYPRNAVACSWGKDSMVLLDLARKVNPKLQVFTIVTPFKPEATNKFREKITKEWNINLKIYRSNATPIKNLWKEDPQDCCLIFKVLPVKEAVENLDCWFSGLRNNEGDSRKEFTHIQKSDNLIKINPILDFTELDIWKYSALYNVPQNPLYKLGYRSLGCEQCTVLIDDSEKERSGRWAGTVNAGKECGIHSVNLRD